MVSITLPETNLGGGLIFYIFNPNPGDMIQFDEHVFQGGLLQPPPSDDFPMSDFLFLDDHLIYPKCFDGPLPVIKGGKTHTDGLVNGIHWGYKPTYVFLFAPFLTVVWALLVDITPRSSNILHSFLAIYFFPNLFITWICLR